jgi:hypothetical protein
LFGDYNHDGVVDLYAVKKVNTAGATEVHILDGASGYQSFLLHSATPLEESGTDDAYEFALGDWNKDGHDDLFIIKRAYTSGTTEVHILSGADGYHTWLAHYASALGPSGTGGEWKFLVGDYNHDGFLDVYAIQKAGTGSGSTEVHVLSGASTFKSWLLHTATPLGQTGADHAWDFALLDMNGDGIPDLVGIDKVGTGSGTTELHVLSGANNFQSWMLHTSTALGLAGNDLSFEFGF